MAIKDLTSETKDYYLRRIGQVTAESNRRWGTMTPAQMLEHVSRLFESSLGDLPVEGKGVLPFKMAKGVVLSGVMPFPRNVLKTPKVFEPNGATSVATERARLEALVDRFVAMCESRPDTKAMNPLFGSLSAKEWQRLHGMHLNHHLTQFGVKN